MSQSAGRVKLAGIQAVSSALKSPRGRLVEIHVAVQSRNSRIRELLRQAERRGIAVIRRDRREIDRLSEETRHQDIVGVFEAANLVGERELDTLLDAIEGDPFLLVLDGVQDPHNLGACLRTAEAAGVHAVIVPKDRAVSLTPVVRRAASGAAEIIDILQVTNLARVLKRLKQRGVWLAGTSDTASSNLYETDLKGPLALVLGGEGEGMRRLTTESCDFLVRVPMAGLVESLNVSVAAGVLLYEAVRQRSGGVSGCKIVDGLQTS